MHPLESLLALSDAGRARIYITAGVLVALIAYVDLRFTNVSLGFLYIVPVLLISGTLRGWQILGLAAVCGILREVFSSLHSTPGGVVRAIVGTAGFFLAGYFVSELNHKRQLVTKHLREREEQMVLREEAEKQLQVLIDTSPLAILTLDGAGKVLLANESAQQVLGVEEPLSGKNIQPYLPILNRFLTVQHSSNQLRTTVESKGQRADSEVFLAHIWLSTYTTGSGRRLAAFVWDASENLRSREGTGLDSMMSTSRVLIGAVSHEIRNLAAAAVAAHRGLANGQAIKETEHYQTLGSIITALEKIAASGLKLASEQPAAVANLGMVLDETRVVIESSFRDSDLGIEWKVASGLPLVQADHHSLLQVFLNLARNSEHAIKHAAQKVLTVEAGVENDLVIVKFRDTGPGVSNPELLFKPFQPGARSTGLGLYVSRAVLLSYGGDLRYEPGPRGGCFVVQLWPAQGSRAHDAN